MNASDALLLLNPWWKTSKIAPDLARNYKRQSFYEASELFTQYRQILVLTGLRRVGKSTIIYQLIEKLLEQHDPQSIVYFTFDYGPVQLVDLLNELQKITGTIWKKEKLFVFLDEVQKLDDWASQVKVVYDAFPNIRLILSGSASIQLEQSAADFLAGRYFSIDVPVLSVVEYYSLRYNNPITDVNMFRDELRLEFDRYLKKPFPELASIDDERRIHEYIREIIISKVVKGDLPDKFKRVDTSLLVSLLDLFYANPGMILNVDSLSDSLSKRKSEVGRHIQMLQYSKLIRIIKNYRPSKIAESRKLRKVYPYDVSLCIWDNPSIDKGKINETLVISRLNAERYWREGVREIDTLFWKGKRLVPIEIKSATDIRPAYTKNLEYFLAEFDCEHGVVLYNGPPKQLSKIRALNLTDFLIDEGKTL